MTTILSLLVLLASPAGNRLEKCKDDCGDDYESDIDSCELLHGDDPDDAEMLILCIQAAVDDYKSCVHACRRKRDDAED